MSTLKRNTNRKLHLRLWNHEYPLKINLKVLKQNATSVWKKMLVWCQIIKFLKAINCILVCIITTPCFLLCCMPYKFSVAILDFSGSCFSLFLHSPIPSDQTFHLYISFQSLHWICPIYKQISRIPFFLVSLSVKNPSLFFLNISMSSSFFPFKLLSFSSRIPYS